MARNLVLCLDGTSIEPGPTHQRGAKLGGMNNFGQAESHREARPSAPKQVRQPGSCAAPAFACRQVGRYQPLPRQRAIQQQGPKAGRRRACLVPRAQPARKSRRRARAVCQAASSETRSILRSRPTRYPRSGLRYLQVRSVGEGSDDTTHPSRVGRVGGVVRAHRRSVRAGRADVLGPRPPLDIGGLVHGSRSGDVPRPTWPSGTLMRGRRRGDLPTPAGSHDLLELAPDPVVVSDEQVDPRLHRRSAVRNRNSCGGHDGGGGRRCLHRGCSHGAVRT